MYKKSKNVKLEKVLNKFENKNKNKNNIDIKDNV
jgi:hypothetical protein